MNRSSTDATRNYFEQAIEAWQPRQAVAHPYAENKIWQSYYVALCTWVIKQRLQHRRVLEIGSGTGLLQDLVEDYVGIDIATSSGRFLRKPFIVGSAAQLPFSDNSFDAAFSVWVLEHVEQPEYMLDELRRVIRPGGTLFLVAAYNVAPWISSGLHRRPFRDLLPYQRLVKLTIPLRASFPYRVATILAQRIGDLIQALPQRPTTLRYRRLTPNFESYWDYDADACVSLDAYNVALYFLTRGDQPLYPVGLVRGLFQRSEPQIYRICK